MSPVLGVWYGQLILLIAGSTVYCYDNQHDSHGNILQQNDDTDSNLKSNALFGHTTTTDESKLRLALLVDDKIDRNKDGAVQLDELVSWLRECQDKYSQEDVNKQWLSHGKSLDDDDTSLSWEEYSSREYDHLIRLTEQSDNAEQVHAIKRSYEKLLHKDKRRWSLADLSGDNRLSKLEFKFFLYPDLSNHMRHLSREEKFEALDRDGDGMISLSEYLADLSGNEMHYFDTKRREDWLKKEELTFTTQLDLDHDNHLNKLEFDNWINKSDPNDDSIAEAQHLMRSADLDRDRRLSKEEILLAYHEFVNSHATDFGEALRAHKRTTHEEL